MAAKNNKAATHADKPVFAPSAIPMLLSAKGETADVPKGPQIRVPVAKGS